MYHCEEGQWLIISLEVVCGVFPLNNLSASVGSWQAALLWRKVRHTSRQVQVEFKKQRVHLTRCVYTELFHSLLYNPFFKLKSKYVWKSEAKTCASSIVFLFFPKKKFNKH